MSIASQLTQRVRIERPVATDDGYGGKSIVWSEVATVFAEVKPVFGAINEREIGAQRAANAGYRLLIRARSDVNAAMRIIWKTHTLLIHSLHENDVMLNLLCYEENV